MSTATQSPPILTGTLAALMVMQAAEREGLPLPYAMSVAAGEVSLQFHLPELVEWAIWLDVPIATKDGNPTPEGGLRFHHVAEAEYLDWPLRLAAVTRGEAVA